MGRDLAFICHEWVGGKGREIFCYSVMIELAQWGDVLQRGGWGNLVNLGICRLMEFCLVAEYFLSGRFLSFSLTFPPRDWVVFTSVSFRTTAHKIFF